MTASQLQADQARRARLAAGVACAALIAGLAAGPALGAPVFNAAQATGGKTPSIETTGATTTVTLKGQRTLIDWTSFNVGGDETVNFQFGAGNTNWIALNRITTGQTTINGAINGYVGGTTPGGNIWIVSPNGLIIGDGASISAGGLLLTTNNMATTDSDFVTKPRQNGFSFTDPTATDLAGRTLSIGAATLKTTGGSLALVAPAITVNARAKIGGDSLSTVLYGAANSYTITFVDPQSQDSGLSLFSFEVAEPTDVTTTPLVLAGQTASGAIYAAGVSKSGTVADLITVSNTMTASAAVADGADIVLNAGGDLENDGGVITAAATTARGDGIRFDGPVTLSGTGVTLNSALTTTGGAAKIDAGTGALTLQTVDTAGGSLWLRAGSAASDFNFAPNAISTGAAPLTLETTGVASLGSASDAPVFLDTKVDALASNVVLIGDAGATIVSPQIAKATVKLESLGTPIAITGAPSFATPLTLEDAGTPTFGHAAGSDFVDTQVDALAPSVTLIGDQGVKVVDPTISHAAIALETVTGDINFTGSASFATGLQIASNGSVLETGTGALAVTGGALSGTALQSLTLTNSGNQIGTLGSFSTGAALDLVTNSGLTVGGQLKTGLNQSLQLTTLGGSLVVSAPIIAGGELDLTANPAGAGSEGLASSNISLDAQVSAPTIRLSALDTISASVAPQVGQTYAISAGDFGGLALTPTFTGTTGDEIIQAGGSLTQTSLSAPGTLAIVADGAVSLGSASAGSGDVRVVSTAGSVSIGSATAGDDILISGQTGVSLGSATLKTGADVNSNTIAADTLGLDLGDGRHQLLLQAPTGSVNFGVAGAGDVFTSLDTSAKPESALTAPQGDVNVNLQTSAYLGSVQANGSATLNVAGSDASGVSGLSLGSVSAGTAATVTLGAGKLDAQSVSAPSATLLASNGDLSVGSLSGQTLSATSLTGSASVGTASATNVSEDDEEEFPTEFVSVNGQTGASLGSVSFGTAADSPYPFYLQGLTVHTTSGTASLGGAAGDVFSLGGLPISTSSTVSSTLGDIKINLDSSAPLTQVSGLTGVQASVSSGDLSVASLSSAGAVTLSAPKGQADVLAYVGAPGSLSVTAQTITNETFASSILSAITGTVYLDQTVGDFGAPGQSLSALGPITVHADQGAITLQTISSTLGDVNLEAATTLQAGSVQGAAVNLTAHGQSLLVAGALTANGTANLISGGSIEVDGPLSAATLTGKAGATASFLGQGGAVTRLAGFSSDGGFSLADGTGLTIAGPVTDTGGPIQITAAGSLSLDGATITAPTTSSVSLQSTQPSGSGGLTGAPTLFTQSSGLVSAGDVSFSAQDGMTLAGSTVATRTLTLSSKGTIDASAGQLAAATLTGSAGGATTLTGQNAIGALQLFDVTAGGLSLLDAQTLTVGGPVKASAGPILLRTTTGDLVVTGEVTAGAASSVTLDGHGALTLGAGAQVRGGSADLSSGDAMSLGGRILLDPRTGVVSLSAGSTLDESAGSISAASLSGSANQTAALTGANQIGTITGFQSSGGLSVQDAVDLTTSGLIHDSAGPITVQTSGALTLQGALTTSGLADLKSGRTLTQTASGVVQARSATLTSSAGMSLAGALTLDAASGVATLNANGGGVQGASLAITASQLTGHAAGDVVLTGPNAVAALGSFSDGAGLFSFAQDGALQVAGTITDTAGGVSLASRSGVLTLAADVNAGSAPLALAGASSTGPGVVQAGGVLSGVLSATTRGGLSLADANTLTGVGAVTNTGFGDVTLVNALGLTGSGSITNNVGGIDVTVQTGGLSLASLSASGASSDVQLQALDPASGSAGIGVGALTVGRDLTLRGQTLQIGAADGYQDFVHPTFVAATGRNLSIQVTAGDFAAGAIAPVGGDLRLEALNGSVSIGSAAAGDDIFIRADHGSASLGAASLTGTRLDGSPLAGFDSVVVQDGLNVSDGAYAVDQAGGLRQLGLTASGTVTLGAPAGTTPSAADTFTASAPVLSELVSDGGGVVVNLASAGAPISLVLAQGGDATLSSASGPLSLGDVRASGGVGVTAGGALSLGYAAAAGGDVRLQAGGDIAFQQQAGVRAIDEAAPGVSAAGSILVHAGGGIGPAAGAAAPSFLASGGVGGPSSLTLQADAGGVTLNTATADASISITAKGGGLTLLGGLTGGGDVTVDTSGDISAGVGPLTAGSSLALTGASLTLANLSASADVLLAATAGDLSVSKIVAGRDIGLSASNSARAVTLDAGRDASVAAGAGLASVTGAIAAGDDISVRSTGGSVSLASATAGQASPTLGSVASLYSDAGPAGSNIAVAADGDVTVGPLQANETISVTSSNGAVVNTAPLLARNGIALTGAAIDSTGGALVAGRAAFASSQPVADAASPANITLTTTKGALTAGSLQAENDIIASSAGALTFSAPVLAGEAIRASAQGDLVAAVDLHAQKTYASADPTVGQVDGAGDLISLTSVGGAVRLASLSADGDIAIQAGSEASGLAAPAVSANTLAAGGSISVTAPGAVAITAAVADPSLASTGYAPQSSAGSLSIASTAGLVQVGQVQASVDAALAGAAGVTASQVVAGRDVQLASSTGGLTLPSVQAGRNASLSAGGAATLGTLLAGVDASATAGGDLTVANRIGAGGSLTLASTGGGVLALKLQAGAGSGPAGDPGPLAGLISPTAYAALAAAEPSHDIQVSAVGAVNVQDAWSAGSVSLRSSGSDVTVGLDAAGQAAGEARAGASLNLQAAGRAWLAAATLSPQAGQTAAVSVSGGQAIIGALPADVGADRLAPNAAAPTDISSAYHLTLPNGVAAGSVQVTANGGLASVRVAQAPGASSALRIDSIAGGDVFVETLGLDTEVAKAVSGDDLYVSTYGGNAILRGGALTRTLDGAGDGFNVAVKASGAGKTALVGADLTLDAQGQPTYAAPGTVYAIGGLDPQAPASGADSFNVISTGGDAGVNLAGDYRLSALSAAGSATAAASGSLQVWSLSAGGDALAAAKAGDAAVEQASAGGDLTVYAGGAAGLRNATLLGSAPSPSGGVYRLLVSGGAGASLGRSVSLAGAADSLAPSIVVAAPATSSIAVDARPGGGGDALVDLNGPVRLAAVYGDRNATVRVSGDLVVGSAGAGPGVDGSVATAGLGYGVTAGSGDLTLSTSGGAALASLSSGGSSAITTGGPLDVSALQAGGQANLKAAGAVTVATLTAGQDANVTAAGDIDVTGRLASSGGGVSLASTGGNIQAASLSAAGSLTLASAKSLMLDSGAAGGDATLTAGGALTIDQLTAGGRLAANTGSTLSAATLTAVGDLSLASAGKLQATGQIASSAGAVSASSTAGDIVLAQAAAAGPLSAQAAGDLTLVTASSGGATALTSGGAMSLGQLSATGPVVLTGGGPIAIGSVLSGGDVSVTGGNGISASGQLASSNGAVSVTSTGGDVSLASVSAAGPLSVASTYALMIANGSSGGAATLTSGGPMSLGAVTTGGAASLNGGGSVTITSLVAAGDVSATSAGDMSVSTRLSSTAGAVTATSTAGSLGLAGVSAGATTVLTAAKAVRVQGLQAQQALLKAGGDVAASGLAVSGAASFSALGFVQLGSASAAAGVVGGGAEVRAGDLNVLGVFSAPTLTVEARYGGVALGATSVSGRSLSLGQSDVDNLSGVDGGRMNLAIYAGLRPVAADPGAVFAGEATTLGDIAVGALGVNSARLQSVSLYASPSNKVVVTGALAPTDDAASTALTIGSLSDPSWRPGLIEVVNEGVAGQAAGSLGAFSVGAARPFQTVSLNAVNDILLGSSAFMAAVEALPAADINLTRNMPAVAPNIGRAEMIVAGALDLQAQGKVLQQNTAGGQGTSTGVLLGGSAVSGPLLTIGTTATGLTSAPTPAVVDLFLSLNDSGATISNSIAATSNRIVLNVAPSNQYRANGCVIGVAGNCSPVDNFIVELQPDRLTEVDLLRRAEDDGVEDPTVAGAANEEIWRKPE